MLANNNIVEPSTSDYRAPIVVMKKKPLNPRDTPSFRFCIDYRELNKRVIPDQYSIDCTDEALESMHGSRYFSTLDLASGF